MPTIIHIDNNAINLEQLTYCSFENNMATFHFTNSKSLSVRCSEKEFEDVLDNSIKTVVPVKNTYAVLQDSETGKKIIAPVSCAVVTHFDNVYYMLPSGEGEMIFADQAMGFSKIIVMDQEADFIAYIIGKKRYYG